jgi:hypothetical protein
MKKKINPKDIKMVKMPNTPYMAELNRRMMIAKTDEQRNNVLKEMQQYMEKMGLVPKP